MKDTFNFLGCDCVPPLVSHAHSLNSLVLLLAL